MKIKLFYLKYCPYCKSAFKALDELKKENFLYKKIEIEFIEENEHPKEVAMYDYQYVPSIFFDQKKIYEANPGESYQEIKEKIRKVLEKALG